MRKETLVRKLGHVLDPRTIRKYTRESRLMKKGMKPGVFLPKQDKVQIFERWP